jgi:pimeloyl-ACP methyl ester carboxylesterase
VAELTRRVEEWRQAGERTHFRGHEIHIHRRAGSQPLLLLLHGFPSSSYDWREVIELLPGHAVLTFDYLGFGLSDKPRAHRYTLAWQTDLAEELVGRESAEGVVVVAHDIGTSVATELMARDLRGQLEVPLVAALLFNGSILQERASLKLGQKLLRSRIGPLFGRMMNERLFRLQFRSLFSDEHPLSDEEAHDQWCVIAYRSGHRIAHLTSSYIDERLREADRWHGAFRYWPKPLQLCWGLRDPVATTAVLEGLRGLRKGVLVTELPDVGHYPQIETPKRIAGAVQRLVSAV